jgi:tryptophan synthase alpha chain
LNNSSGFLYYVSVAGVTGTKVPVRQIVANEIKRIKNHTDLPVCVGFGIKTPEDAKAISTAADGVVVGSAIIETIQKGATDSEVSAFISALSQSVHLK